MTSPDRPVWNFTRLAENSLWSNHRLHDACAALPEAEYFQERAAFFGSIHGTLLHILENDQIYMNRMNGLDRDAATPIALDHAALASLTQAQRDHDRRLLAFCQALGSGDLDKSAAWRGADGTAHSDPLAAVLLHLFLHQVHHRGQVHGLLSQTSVAPPQLDEFFLSEDLPLRADELRRLGIDG